jgi:tripartite-type tricarboxylate transporter receptor subunit TctC
MKKEKRKMRRNKLTILCLLLLTVVFGLSLAWGDEYPSKPINFLIPFGAGGSADVMGRTLATGTEPYLGQPIVPINKPGAGGGIMYTALKAAKPDGYTVGWNSTSILTTTNIGNVPFKYDAFDYVCRIGFTAMPLAVRKDAPWKNFKEFVDYAKKNPGKIKIGNAGTGSGTHLTAVLLEKETGIKVVHVPLGAKRRIPSLLGGEVEAICVPLPEVAPQIEGGQARLLIMPTEKRDPMFPDIPTAKELGYPVVMELFRGISMPKGTPQDIINKLADAFKKGADDANFKKIAKKTGFNISFMGNKEFEEYLKVQNANIAEGMKLGGLIK